MIDHDELTNFRADVPPMTEDAFRRGLRQLQEAPTVAPRLRSSGRWYALTAVAAAAAVLVAGVITVGHRGPSDSAAAQILDDAAARAIEQPALRPERGQFVYQRVDSLGNGAPETVEYWIPADSTSSETICVSGGGCTVLAYDRHAVKNQGLPYSVLTTLPTTGAAMLEYLRADPITAYQRSTGRSPDLAIWNTALQLGDLLPPAQQAALFQALAHLHGARPEGNVTTFDGRAGIAVGMKDPDAGDEQLVFTADTHEYLGFRNVQPHDDGPPTTFNTSRTANAVVDHARERP